MFKHTHTHARVRVCCCVFVCALCVPICVNGTENMFRAALETTCPAPYRRLMTLSPWQSSVLTLMHWRKSRGDGGGMYPPTFWGGGMACTKIPPPPPLFEDKITLNLTFIVKKLTFLTVKLLKTPKIARSHTNVFWDSIIAVLPVHVFFS